MKAVVLFLVFSCFCFPVSLAWAFGSPPNGRDLVRKHGCGACHAWDGSERPEGIPKLAGQKYGYLVRALTHLKFKEVKSDQEIVIRRIHPIMNEMARSLKTTEMADIAAFYSTRACTGPVDVDIANIVQPDGVAKCEICHGGMRSNPWADTPYLAGQDRAYLLAELRRLWEDRNRHDEEVQRHHRLSEIMFDEGKQYKLEELADYFAALPCRPPNVGSP